MAQALDLPGNPSSIHRAGRAARAIVEDAREAVAQLAGANPGDVIFTGSGTEANALALRGLSRAMGCSAVVCSAVEHSSVIANMTDIDSFLPVDANGVLDLAMLERRLSTASAPLLVSVMLANNETGIIQPVAEIARIVHAAKGYVHCDAIQGPGRMAFSLDGLGLLGFEAAIRRDYPIMFATLYIFTLLGLLMQIVGDLMYTVVDPRIDFEARR
jgi:cysteine desulfurase